MEGGRILRFHPDLERVVFLLKLRVGSCQVLDPFLMVSLCFGELRGFGLEIFDASGQSVHDVGFLVGSCHCEWSIGKFGQQEELDGNGLRCVERDRERESRCLGRKNNVGAARRNNNNGEAGNLGTRVESWKRLCRHVPD